MLDSMLTGQLLGYQVPAADEFLRRGNLLVTMDPGTGKTIVAIAAAEDLLSSGDISTCLCVVPASLKYQWAQRLAEFTDLPAHEIKAGREVITVPRPPGCVIIDGTEARRDKQYASISAGTEYVILGYPNVLHDWLIISQLPWQLVVLDEITAIKNPGSDISRAVKETFGVPWRLGLTGTPVENKPEELYSIMSWISPGYLGDPATFDQAFVKRNSSGDIIRYRNLPVLHQQLRPVMYRKKRTDPDVAPYFPREDEGTWSVPMPPALREAYLTLASDLLGSLRAMRRRGSGFDVSAAYRGGKPDEGTAVGRIAAKMQAMEMLTCHPALIEMSSIEYRLSEEARNRGAEKAAWPGSRWCSDIVKSGIISADAALAYPKLDFLLDRCRAITRDPAPKILVYTKYARMLPLLSVALELKGIGTVRYSGEMNAARKAETIARFTSDPDCRVFLSSHAGAYGCDMYMASYLVNYDIPWSGGKAAQIDGRHVRASNSNETVYIRHLLLQGSLDGRQLSRVRFKRRLASAIIDGTGADHLGRIENDIGTLTSHLEDLLAWDDHA